MDESFYFAVEDICQRVFGVLVSCDMTQDQGNQLLVIRLKPKRRQDMLTQSQQEMDAILSIQHLLTDTGWSVRLDLV